ncbi:MAG: spore cortex-lytic protein [Ruminococcaceae bacterium]|nr:spore cortex-lytic protein [Oscillospiraceae bacterium]
MPTNLPFIPEFITVHLGPPDSNSPNVTLPFADYIANVASSEVYPTWPESALRANIYAQISFALNRIYTEYYRSRGYDFDITNSIAIDQSFVNGRDIFDNVQSIVNDIFDSYLRRQGNVEPLFAQYCDGIEVMCNGLSQWGSLDLANRGYSPYEIITYYYGDDIDIVQDAPVQGISASVPSYPLQLGSTGDDVRSIQIRLNRISSNFPAIPKISPPFGVFADSTDAAVRKFQEIFGLTPDGIIGRATWYKIQNIYNSVKRLNALNSEGITLEEITQQFPSVLSEGSRGIGVTSLQYYLDYLSDFYDTIPSVAADGVFGPSTTSAVIAAQNAFGLTPDGVVGEETWRAIYNAYIGIVRTIPIEYRDGNVIPFPGVFLTIGSESEAVRVIQEYLNYISEFYPEIPSVNPTGYYGQITQESVTAFQEQFGLPSTGTVGPVTWDRIADLYSDLYNGSNISRGQFPGYNIGE